MSDSTGDWSIDSDGNLTSSAPSLTASTGANDSNSVWGSGLLQTAETLGASAASTALTQALAAQTTVKAPSSSAPGASGKPGTASWQTYLPWIIGAAVVGAIAWLLLRKS